MFILGGKLILGGVGVGFRGWASGGGVVWAKRLQKAIASLLSLVMHPVLRSFDEIIFTLNFSLTPPSIHFSFKYACVFTT